MKFKKMEIYGFKSFADKVQISFNDGVTGIVGPNGCGKSNVADSIRWVLGEQSAKALRGSSMQDVIFNGTEKRKPQSFSEVSLTFDNTEKIFDIDYDEVSLSRKLYRSGDSEYAINKSPCRLKDVVDLLRDSGLGRDGYNIIGQGKIDELLSARPDDRRAVFEDAAGISKLKNRKYESEKKLSSTNDNLTRIDDILHELELQLGPLEKQAETAKKYLDLHEKLRVLDANNYVYQYDNASEKKSIVQNRLNGAIEEISLREQEFKTTIDDYNKTAEMLGEIDGVIESLRDELLNLTVGLEKQAGETRLLQEKISILSEQKQQYETSLKLGNDEILRDDNSIKSFKQSKFDKEQQLTELNVNIDDLQQQIDSLSDEIVRRENSANEKNSKIVEDLNKLGDIKAQISGLNSEKYAFEKRIKEIDEENIEISKKNAEKQIEIDQINQTIDKIVSTKNTIQNNIKLEKQDQLKLIYKINALEEDIKDSIAKLSGNNSKIKLLKALQEENEGYISSIKQILKDSKSNASLAGRFVNVVAKLMTVPEEYECAIDIALGASVQNIVTKDEDDAKYVIEHLKENNLGRATFLPMTSVRPHELNNEYRRTISKFKGVKGVADELISFDKQYKNVFSSLLGTTVIVDNIDTAIKLARECRYGFKIVTLEGDVLTPNGTMAGGSRKTQSVSLIGREREIQNLKSELDSIQQEKENSEIELVRLKQGQSKYDAKFEEYNKALESLDEKLVKEKECLSTLMSSLNESKNLIEKNENLKRVVTSNLKNTEEKINLFVKYQTDFDNGMSGENIVVDSELLIKKNELNKLNNQLTEMKVKRASVEGEKVSVDGELLRLLDEREKDQKQLSVIKLEYQKCLTELQELKEKYDNSVDKTAFENGNKTLSDVRNDLASKDEEKKLLNAKLTELSDKKVIVSGQIQSANEKKYKEENALLKIDSDIENLQEKIWEDYGLTYATAVELKQPNHNIEEGLTESARIKKEISGLGNINVNSIESLVEVKSRFEDLSTQKEDLDKAKNDLIGIIESLTNEMKNRFVTEFNKINDNFKDVFKELFGGGKAELKLLDIENPLECGIEIEAEPTGKKLQNITLLSGGERALTAIAILFAILKLKPMPFCVLDEIEAALDDANVDRFARYLKRFSHYTQFIVITHRKPTMELADSLYGVTMEERGVSKIVSVKLADAVKTAQPALKKS